MKKKLFGIMGVICLLLGVTTSSAFADERMSLGGTKWTVDEMYDLAGMADTDWSPYSSGGWILEVTKNWKYSQGIAYVNPKLRWDGSGYSFVDTKVTMTSNSSAQSIMVYLDEWNTATNQWDEVGHTGSYRSSAPITSNSFGIIEFESQYGQSHLTPEYPYRLRFSSPNAIDYTQTAFYTEYLPGYYGS